MASPPGSEPESRIAQDAPAAAAQAAEPWPALQSVATLSGLCIRPSCGRPLPLQTRRRGSPRVYCSDACRIQHWNELHPRVRTPEQLRLLLGRVRGAADPAWLAQAREAVLRCAEALPDWIGDDVWRFGLEPTREARALGPVIQALAREGLICRTGQYRPSARSNRSPKPVWRRV